MRQSKRVALGAFALALTLLTGCADRPAAAEKHRVTLVAKSTNTEFWKTVFAGAEAAAAEYNLDLFITGPETEEDYATQNQMVAQAVADGTEVLVFSAIDYEKNASAINDAAAAGVKIVTIDSDVHSDATSTYIGTDNYAAGQQAAVAALKCEYPHLYVGLVNYDINSANGQERETGVRDTFAPLDNVTVVESINVAAAAQPAQAGTAALLKANPEINVLIAFNEPVSVGAARAVTELKQEDRIWLVGFDSNVETVDNLQTGVVNALIVQNSYAMGYLGVESAYRLLTGQSGVLQPTVDTSTFIVTQENLFTADSQKALFAFE
ncbi:substrate-binding domain-containing protein [Oscillibacter valericigenes]|nr:substrate-binding domain-containing protein [Oscillibacter valericigenes]